jgi:hypothetical protein
MNIIRQRILAILMLLVGLLLPVTTLSAGNRLFQATGMEEAFTVASTSPAANALAVDPGTSVLATFSQAPNPASVSATTFVIHGSQTGTYDGARVFPTAESARFDPAATFKPGEIVTVSAGRGILSNTADPLDPPFVWQFEIAPGTPGGVGSGIFDPKPVEDHTWEDGPLALGDVDGDGDLDALIDSEIWFGQGNGQFVKSSQNLKGPDDLVPAFGDLDGDGDLDAIIPSNSGSGSNRLWINDGSGNFSASGNDVGETGNNVIFGDVDGDGDLDMYMAKYGGGDIWINDGQAGFTASGQNLGGNYDWNVFFRDFDSDSDLDLLIDMRFGPKLYLNNGSGLFSLSPHDFPDAGTPDGISVGDFDADGDVDVLAIVEQWTGYLWRNDGSGKFSGQEVFRDAPNGDVLEPGDLDGDGDLDIFLATWEDTAVYLNDGQGTFTRDDQVIRHGAWRIKLGDLDGDGDLDAFYSKSADGLRGVYLNRDRPAPQTFWVETTQPAANEVATSLSGPLQATFNKSALAPSLNSDTVHLWGEFSGEYEHTITPGDKQVTIEAQEAFKPGERMTAVLTTAVESTVGDPLSRNVWQFTAEATAGSGLFKKSAQTMDWQSYSSSILADIDGDRDLDLITTFCEGEIDVKSTILKNDGSGTFKVIQELDIECAKPAAAGDLDGDGHIDLVLGRGGIWFNDGAGEFNQSSQEFPILRGVALGDLDADGDLDMVLATGIYEGSDVWFNDGSGSFSKSGQTIDIYGNGLIELGDLDVDGDLDLVFAGYYSSTWLNNGQGYFSWEDRSLQSSNSGDMAIGDADGDGDLDVLLTATSSPPNGVFLLLNNGQGVLSEKRKLVGNASSGAFADVDADGDLDILFAILDQTVVFMNDGRGKFTPSNHTLPWSGEEITPGDLDGDGDIDFVLSDSRDHKNLVFFNYGQQSLLPIIAGVGRP